MQILCILALHFFSWLNCSSVVNQFLLWESNKANQEAAKALKHNAKMWGEGSFTVVNQPLCNWAFTTGIR